MDEDELQARLCENNFWETGQMFAIFSGSAAGAQKINYPLQPVYMPFYLTSRLTAGAGYSKGELSPVHR